ncbi:MAG: hypothetical protein CME06_10830 [Gemmatimonadetes bacterium]|nr:hypothetical protein [Gemmatimonadota bacterium]
MIPYTLLPWLAAISASAANPADPRDAQHGVAVNAFSEAGALRYLLAWSSSAHAPWEHDIYVQRIHFEQAVLLPEMPPLRAIGTGSDGAQEPVDPVEARGLFLTAWEDGTGQTIDVRAVLHDARGDVERAEWIVAGGESSQHSVSTAALRDGFVVAYADEAPPAQAAMIEVALFDLTGS